MRIRDEHIAAQEARMHASFHDRLFEPIQRLYPELVWNLTDDALLARLRKAIDLAGRFELEAEEDVASFVELTFELSPTFHRDPEHAWAREILEDRSHSPGERVERVWEILDDLDDEEEGAPPDPLVAETSAPEDGAENLHGADPAEDADDPDGWDDPTAPADD